jgi:DNA transposition AAA+ family ATPase
MKNEFIYTNNVKSMFELADLLMNNDVNTPGLGLYYGEPGLGKTEAAQHLCLERTDYVYIRAKTAWTIRWMLNDLLNEVNEQGSGRTELAYERIVKVLREQPRLIVIDEVDHMMHDSKVIETLRDIYDESGNPFLMVGMQGAERKLKRFPHLYSRFAEVKVAEKISSKEIMLVADRLCELPMEDKIAGWIYERTNGEFRKIMRWLKYYERKALANSQSSINTQLIPRGK